MRANHNDSKYVFHWQRYAKEFVIKLWHYANLVSANDMAVIREPEHAISTGVHAHNPSLGFIRFKYCHRCIRSWLENCENNSFCQFICRYSRIEPRNIPLWTTCGDACPMRHGTELTAQIKNRVDNFLKSVLITQQMLITQQHSTCVGPGKFDSKFH